MARGLDRRLGSDANLEHMAVQRNSSGTAQVTRQATQNTGNTVSGTTTVTQGTVTLNTGGDNLVCFTSATLKGSGGGGGNSPTVQLLRDGNAIATTSATGAFSTSISNSHTTVLNAPQYQVQVSANGGTNTWSLTLSRESKW